MPDWFYQPIARPLLFRLPAERARSLALGFMGGLARLPLGPLVIDFLGHMRPDPRLARSVLGSAFATPVGLGPALDSQATALPAMVRLGFGFLDVGPISIEPIAADRPLRRLPAEEGIGTAERSANLGLAAMRPRLTEAASLGRPILAGIVATGTSTPAEVTRQLQKLIDELSPLVSAFVSRSLEQAVNENWPLDGWTAHVDALLQSAAGARAPRPLLLSLAADGDLERAATFLQAALDRGVAGIAVDGSTNDGDSGRMLGLRAQAPALALIGQLRARFGNGPAIVAAGGVHEPSAALAILDAGADLVELDTGLVYSGPGLAKRTNDALLADQLASSAPAMGEEPRPARMSWFWLLLLGIGMSIGSIMALAIAATRQVLPYDESFVCMPREMLAKINSRLLPFMAHDRVSLAGTMVAIGIMYASLAWFGARRGAAWARTTILVSAFVGFVSFFLFLGFGYLDPLHAFVTSILLQLTFMAMHARRSPYVPTTLPYLHNEPAWQTAQWGQLLLIVHGVALLVAGAAIATIGATSVFVAEDLQYMGTTADVLAAANPRLVPLVAHDRATFGGMLLASGCAFLLPALWGFGSPARWLWRTMAIAGGLAYAAAIGVHLVVGYLDVRHLLPAIAGMALLAAGLALSRRYLAGGSPANHAAWAKRLSWPGRSTTSPSPDK